MTRVCSKNKQANKRTILPFILYQKKKISKLICKWRFPSGMFAFVGLFCNVVVFYAFLNFVIFMHLGTKATILNFKKFKQTFNSLTFLMVEDYHLPFTLQEWRENKQNKTVPFLYPALPSNLAQISLE